MLRIIVPSSPKLIHILCEVIFFFDFLCHIRDRLCGLVVRVPAYRSRGPGLIPGATRISDKQWSGTGSIQPRGYN
jgi:hypothetical protein